MKLDLPVLSVAMLFCFLAFRTACLPPSPTPSSSPPDSGSGQTPEDHKLGEALVVYFVIVCIVLGAVCREVKRVTGVPYTPMLLVFGVLLGAFTQKLGDLGMAVRVVLRINPHGILFIFIPALIFESAFNIDAYLFKRSAVQILLLAVPGVAVGAVLLSLGFRVLLGYGDEFSWAGCLTFSSILCATDPVAVVALLKELGTPQRFNLLLEGESLLNDGTAMVFYIVFSSLYKGLGSSLLESVAQFLRLSLGGAAVGAVVWVLVTQWIRRIVRDDVHTTNLTFLACYLAFFVSEFYLEVSGIIAIVSLGVLFSVSGKSKVHPDSQHSVHAVWTYIQYLLETVLFVLTGCFIGQDLVASPLGTIESFDMVRAVGFFFLMTAVRAIMLFLLRPLLNRTGYPVDTKMIVVLTYGGLRGAVALSLGLMVLTDAAFPDRFKDLVIFYLACMIVATVVLNGLSIKCVMRKIRFVSVHPVTARLHTQLQKRLVIRSYEQKIWLERHRFLSHADWRQVFRIAGVFSDLEALSRGSRSDRRPDYLEMTERASQAQLLPTPASTLPGARVDSDELVEARLRCYQMVKKELQNMHLKGYCSDDVVETLKDMVDLCMEDAASPIWVVDRLLQSAISLEWLAFWVRRKDTLLLGVFARKIFADGMLGLYDLIYCLINGLKNVQSHKSKLLLGHHLLRKIFSEIERQLEKLEAHMFSISDMFPDIVASLQSRQAAKVLLNDRKNFLEDCFDNGVLSDTEFDRLRHDVDARLKHLSTGDFEHRLEGFSDLQFACPIFRHVSDWDCVPGLRDLLASGQKERFNAGDVVLRADKPVFGVYILTRGRVQETVVNADKLYEDRLGDGAVLNFANVLGANPRARSSVEALAPGAELVFCPAAQLKKLMLHNPAFADEVYREALVALLKAERSFADFVFDDVVMLNILSEAKVRRFDEDIHHSFSQTCFLLRGSAENQTTGQSFLAPLLLPRNQILRFLEAECVVVVVPQDMHVYVRHDFRFSTDKAVDALGKVSLGRVSGLHQNSFIDELSKAKKDGQFVDRVFSMVKKKLSKL